jgi:hypothetical protein
MPIKERRPKHRKLRPEQSFELHFGFAAATRGSAFASDTERREAWFRHRAELLGRCHPGQRPAAWWEYEGPTEQPVDRGDAERLLYDWGELTKAEIDALMPDWRLAFDESQASDFCFDHYEGERARREHYRWAGIPDAVIAKWEAERARKEKLKEKEATR